MQLYLTYISILQYVDNTLNKLDSQPIALLQDDRHRIMLYQAIRTRDSILDSCKVADVVLPMISHDNNGDLQYVLYCICIYIYICVCVCVSIFLKPVISFVSTCDHG